MKVDGRSVEDVDVVSIVQKFCGAKTPLQNSNQTDLYTFSRLIYPLKF